MAVISAIFAGIFCFTWAAANTVSESSTWYEHLPAVALDYKVKIDAGKEDCYYQYVQPGATFYANFQVMRGGDGMAGFAVKDPAGAIVHPYQWLAQSDYQGVATNGGYYSVCVDNQFSRFSEKLVNLYITVIKYDQWEQFNKEIEEMNLSVQNVTSSLSNVEHRISTMLQYQHHSRSKESRDYNLLLESNWYVVRWSCYQIFCIVLISWLQVRFVRKFFDIKKDRPRA